MSEQVRQLVQASVPTQVTSVDAEELWRRGRQRRRVTRILAGVACAIVFVGAGWSMQQLAAPTSLTDVGAPDDGGPSDLEAHPDAVWREPADNAVHAVEKFMAVAFGWAASDLTTEGGAEAPGPMYFTVSHDPTGVSVTVLVTPAPEQQWQVVTVESEGTRGGSVTPQTLRLPVPDGAAIMDVHAFMDGHTVHYRGEADAIITADELDAADMATIGGVLVVYRDASGRVVGANGGQFGMGGELPTAPASAPPADGG